MESDTSNACVLFLWLSHDLLREEIFTNTHYVIEERHSLLQADRYPVERSDEVVTPISVTILAEYETTNLTTLPHVMFYVCNCLQNHFFFFHWPSFSNVYTKQSVEYLFNKSLLVMEIEAAGAHVDDRAR